MKRVLSRIAPFLAVLALSTGAVGCGHSDEEMAAKQREIDQLGANLKVAKAQHEDDERKAGELQKSIDELKAKLRDAGLGLEKSEEEKAKLRRAMDEYEARLKQLDDMRNRFKDLKARLDKLTNIGLKVVVRNNRMVIQLPGDILFDSGMDTLKPDGKKILKQVADVINGDSQLKQRYFLIAGHTDNVEYGGPFRDNWGLALMRARQVLLFMVGPIEAKGPAIGPKKDVPNGGGLDQKRWAAAGYGVTDPIAGSVEKQSEDDKKKNRRVELVLQPNVEEMLNLKDFGG